MEPPLLSAELDLPAEALERLVRDYEGDLLGDPAVSIPEVALDRYGVDLAARYGPLALAHPIGKASGQLSLAERQVASDAEAGLAFVVLKTVIAEDEAGTASMGAWKIHEPRMVVERIEGKRLDRSGWTVSWAGRGWEGTLESYIDFLRAALPIGAAADMPVIPSCKYHLPTRADEDFLTGEYEFTTRRLGETWREAMGVYPLVLEQDFSPTLAGADSAQSKQLILRWLIETPALIKAAAVAPGIVLGIKVMNALFEDEFQLEMLRALAAPESPADFLICFNRLFDPDWEFGKKRGIAYGGPDLSDRNLSTLRRAIESKTMGRDLPICATGDITSGRMMIEYALRGATSGQLHTYFQLPLSDYRLSGVSRVRAALHELYFHPANGIIAAMIHLRERHAPGADRIAFLDLPKLGRSIFPRGEAGA